MYDTQGRKDSYGGKIGGYAEEKMIRRTLTQRAKQFVKSEGPCPFAEAGQPWLGPTPGPCCAGSFHFLFV